MTKLVLCVSAATASLLAMASLTRAEEPKVITPPWHSVAPGPASYTPGPGGSKPAPATAAPQAAGPMKAIGSGKPAAQMERLRFLVGKWQCDGRQFATSSFGPEHTFKGAADAKMDNDNFWQTWTYEEKETKEHRGFRLHGMWGWDDGSKHFVRAGGDNRGNWDTASAPTPFDDRIVWTGELSGAIGRITFHHTFRKKSDKEWTHTLEIKMPDGSWTPLEEATCRK